MFPIPISLSQLDQEVRRVGEGVQGALTPNPRHSLDSELKSDKILIVDDSKVSLRIVQKTLENAGFRSVLGVSDPREAAQTFQDYGPDLVILDLNMPHLDGIEVLKQLRSRTPERSFLPIVLLSGDESLEKRERALAAGAIDFLSRSLEPSEVLLRIRNLLETRFLHAQLQHTNCRLEDQVRARTRELHTALETQIKTAKKYKTIFEDAPVGIANIELDSRYVEVNPKYCQITGYQRDELLGKETRDLMDSSEEMELFSEAREKLLSGAISSYGGEKQFNHRDGAKVWGYVTITLAQNSKGEPSYFIVVVEDITERKLLEEQFRQSQKLEALGLLAGGVAHDFNNMMSVVIGYSSLLLSKPSVDPQCLQGLEMIKQAGEHAAGLTRQLLAFSRKQILSPVRIDLNGVVGHTHKMLRRLITEDIELVTLPSPEPLPLFADPGQVEQVLINLVVNARDAMPQGGQLTIQSQRVVLDEDYARLHSQTPPGAYAVLSVSDTGVGMDRETQKHVFEPFFTTKEKGKGTGLGLSTVYGIVKQSGGQIELYSEAGQGTVFKIYLPLLDQNLSESPSEQDPREDLRGGATLLVVEDEPMVRSLVSATLQSHGHVVVEAGNGEEGLRLYEQHLREKGGIDLVLTDTIMPQMGGRELAERIKADHPEQKVLFMSGYTDDIIVRHGVLEAGVQFLQKPFTPQVLLEKVKGLLQGVEVHS